MNQSRKGNYAGDSVPRTPWDLTLGSPKLHTVGIALTLHHQKAGGAQWPRRAASDPIRRSSCFPAVLYPSNGQREHRSSFSMIQEPSSTEFDLRNVTGCPLDKGGIRSVTYAHRALRFSTAQRYTIRAAFTARPQTALECGVAAVEGVVERPTSGFVLRNPKPRKS